MPMTESTTRTKTEMEIEMEIRTRKKTRMTDTKIQTETKQQGKNTKPGWRFGQKRRKGRESTRYQDKDGYCDGNRHGDQNA